MGPNANWVRRHSELAPRTTRSYDAASATTASTMFRVLRSFSSKGTPWGLHIAARGGGGAPRGVGRVPRGLGYQAAPPGAFLEARRFDHDDVAGGLLDEPVHVAPEDAALPPASLPSEDEEVRLVLLHVLEARLEDPVG